MKIKIALGTLIAIVCCIAIAEMVASTSVSTVHAPSEASPYGLNVHMTRPMQLDVGDQLLAKLKDMGGDWIRVCFDWNVAERQKGEFDFSNFDKAVEFMEKYNIQICGLVANPPSWALPLNEHRKEYLEFLRAITKRYRGSIRYWEIWNEPNSQTFWGSTPSPIEYTELLKDSTKAIREIIPDAVILYAGVAGVPEAYIEECFKAGAAEAFDIMNVHPYDWPWEPENTMVYLEKLKKLMAKYQINKPIWVTEFGWSTMYAPNFYTKLLPAMFEKIGIEPQKCAVALIDDPEFGYNHARDYDFSELYGLFAKVEKFKFSEIPQINVAEYPVIIPALSEEFPSKYIPALRDYVKRGGTMLLLKGSPFYYDLQCDFKNGPRRLQVNDKYMADFHIGWDAFWTNRSLPTRITWQRPAKEFVGKIELPPETDPRFLHTRNMKAGDTFIPVVEAGNDNFSGVIAGIYRFNSDLKGNCIFCIGCGQPWINQYIGEERQAEYVPRFYLLAELNGVEKSFIYNLRNDEWYKNGNHREAHFGLLRQNLDPKPAYFSFQTLTRMRPVGSTRLEQQKNPFVWIVSWRRPDGKKVWALWTRFKLRHYDLYVSGEIENATDFVGNPLEIPRDRITVTPQIQYLVGPETLKLKASSSEIVDESCMD